MARKQKDFIVYCSDTSCIKHNCANYNTKPKGKTYWFPDCIKHMDKENPDELQKHSGGSFG